MTLLDFTVSSKNECLLSYETPKKARPLGEVLQT